MAVDQVLVAIFGAVVVSGLKFILTGLVPELWPFILAILWSQLLSICQMAFLMGLKYSAQLPRNYSPLRIGNYNHDRVWSSHLRIRTKRVIWGIFGTKNFKLLVNFGEVKGVIGPNGAGKTTLLDALTGKTEYQSGDIFVRGRHNIKDANEPVIARLGLAASFRSQVFFRG